MILDPSRLTLIYIERASVFFSTSSTLLFAWFSQGGDFTKFVGVTFIPKMVKPTRKRPLFLVTKFFEVSTPQYV